MSSRLTRLAEIATEVPLVRRGIGHVVDRGIGSVIGRLRDKSPHLIDLLRNDDLLKRNSGKDTPSEEVLRAVIESHRMAGIGMLEVIKGTGDYRAMVSAVIDGLEDCKTRESGSLDGQIDALEDPLARALLRAFMFQRDYYLEFLKFLKKEGLDNLNGADLLSRLPEITERFRNVQVEMLQDLQKKDSGIVAAVIAMIIAMKRAGRTE